MPARVRGQRGQRGFSLVEVLVAALVLVIALLANAGTVGSGQQNQQYIAERRMAHEVFRRFVEGLRDAASEDTGAASGALYLKLKSMYTTLLAEATAERVDTAQSYAGEDPGLRLSRSLGAAGLYPARPNSKVPASSVNDHYGWLTPNPVPGATDPYMPFEIPAALGEVGFSVEVPAWSTATDTRLMLRENKVAPRYGMNLDYTFDGKADGADLNGDGLVDGTAREDKNDYKFIPCVVRMRWERRGKASQEIVMPMWLRRPAPSGGG
ncbi:MAG: prepilin-type N-terminal cleavage/methylation domain-containing protein [Planctomycetia bacterium]